MEEQKYMLRAIELAKMGCGFTNPNPMVGAVIVKDGRVIGEGYHKRCGELHAERNAIANLTESAEGATIYVTLEPCCHYGKTPPCTEAIIENKIAKVVIGSRDPNPLVSGKGAKLLREHGIEVVEDFMKEECDEINRVFFHFITKNRPFMVMKYAMTLDGKIATYSGKSKWITGTVARNHVQKLRGTYNAILAGIGTVLADDPLLNCRIEGAHQPLRIIVDSKLQIPLDSQICKTAREFPTVVAYASADSEVVHAVEEAGITLLQLPDENGQVNLEKLISWMGEQKIDSCLVEGGGILHEALCRLNAYDYVYAYVAPKIFGGEHAKTPVEGKGVEAPDEATRLRLVNTEQLGDDLLLEYEVKKEGCLQEL